MSTNNNITFLLSSTKANIGRTSLGKAQTIFKEIKEKYGFEVHHP